MRRAYMANASLSDMQLAADHAYEDTGKVPTAFRACRRTVRAVLDECLPRQQYTGFREVRVWGVPLTTDDRVLEGFVAVDLLPSERPA